MEQEIFKPIPGYYGKYEVSNYGKVKSLINRYTARGNFNLSPDTSNKGYKRVQLSQPRSKLLVHRLVAQAFIPNPNNLPVVNHLDNNPSNNYYKNLEWTTTSGNLIHAQKQGRLTDAQRKGGIATGVLTHRQAIKNASKVVGKTFNDWKILSIENNNSIDKRVYVKCQCKCGDIYIKPYTFIISERTKSCQKCSKINLKDKRNKEISEELTNKVIGTWKFTGNTNYLQANKPNSKYLRVEATCVNCNITCMHPYPSLTTKSKQLKKCPNCLTR